uniref:Uncharacterized protein n=1 Tax=Arion vulgaris TaxID=1028688 RepID=A0A0B6Y0I5_9EUPU
MVKLTTFLRHLISQVLTLYMYDAIYDLWLANLQLNCTCQLPNTTVEYLSSVAMTMAGPSYS